MNEMPASRPATRPFARLAGPLLIAATCIVAPAQAAAKGAVPGTFEGKLKQGEVTVVVADSLKAKLRYTVKTSCGREQGKVRLGKLDDNRFKVRSAGKGGHALTVRGRVLAGGRKLRGRLDPRCSGAARRWSASLGGGGGTGDGGGGTGSGPAEARSGRYQGETSEGLPISFEVHKDGGKPTVENLAFDVYLSCFGVQDDHAHAGFVGHLTEISGGVDDTGYFDAFHSEDVDENTDVDDVDYGASGEFDGASAKGDLEVWAGVFDALGNRTPAGPWQCWEANDASVTFEATRQ